MEDRKDLMDILSSPALSLTSDPALLNDWEWQLCEKDFKLSFDSDEVEALHLVQEETTAWKNRTRVVIQHRAWQTKDIFRSEADYIDETPVRSKQRYRIFSPPSSPPIITMPSASSPVAYPDSSPPSKRIRVPEPQLPMKPRKVGGFLMDEDSEDDFALDEPTPKRRMLDASRPPISEIQNHGLIDRQIVTNTLLGNQFVVQTKPLGRLPEPSSAASFSTPSVQDGATLESVSMPYFLSKGAPKTAQILTCSGKSMNIKQRRTATPISFEELVASRSTVKVGRAKKSYYGIDIHGLIEEASKQSHKDKAAEVNPPVEAVVSSIEHPDTKPKPRKSLMWTEKYRARHFMELCGDDRTHRQVLKWLKAWDPIVFPKSGKPKPVAVKRPGAEGEEEKTHRKILLLTGPPGLGKTTLAHVCARQAGYEVMEINASDERSSNVVKGRIRTSVGTESVKTGSTVTSKAGHVQKTVHPLCVVIDEVDGVVSGSGGSGEGGFVKALIDLILLDQKNTSSTTGGSGIAKKKKKGDDFKLLRPLILICNDVYHPSLRPLRQSNFAEIIHVRKPPMDAVVGRMKSVFEKEGVNCDSDAVRRLCEATWGVNASESRKGKEGTAEGDLRSIMVVGEWAAGKLKASRRDGAARLTRKWVEDNMMSDLSHGGGAARGVGRGGSKEVSSRVFLEGAGFPKMAYASNVSTTGDSQPKTQLGVAELAKKAGMDRLREMVDTSGDIDRIVTDIFSEYPTQPFNDDNILSKPDAAYEWLYFHDTCSSRVFTEQAFELAPYLSQPVLACHHLFASPARHYFAAKETKKWEGEEAAEDLMPFSGPRANYSAHEAEKANRATILSLQASLNATLLRSFRSPEDIATDLLPYLVRMLTPEIKPIIVGGSGDQKGIASVRKESEKAMVKRAVDIMGTVGVTFERGKLEGDFGNRGAQWVYRMEPPLDPLVVFETASLSMGAPAPVRYAVRQVLDQEYQKNIIVRENAARQARYKAGNPNDDVEFSMESKENKKHQAQARVLGAKKDFFGREVIEESILQEIDGNAEVEGRAKKTAIGKEDNKVWVSFHEGFSNAVKKPITIEELLRGL